MMGERPKTEIEIVRGLMENYFGNHPLDWPVPQRTKRPFSGADAKCGHALEYLRDSFCTGMPRRVDQAFRDRYWAQAARGQSPFEDAGGYALRCWMAALGYDVNAPTYADVAQTFGLAGAPAPEDKA